MKFIAKTTVIDYALKPLLGKFSNPISMGLSVLDINWNVFLPSVLKGVEVLYSDVFKI